MSAKELNEILPFGKDINNIIINMVEPYKFIVGKEYHRTNYFDGSETILKHKVIKRTKCFITIEGNYESSRYKIKYRDNGDEFIMMGNYRAAPCLFSSDMVEPYKFIVGKIYYREDYYDGQGEAYQFEIIERDGGFITIKGTHTSSKYENTNGRYKIRYTAKGDEFITLRHQEEILFSDEILN